MTYEHGDDLNADTPAALVGDAAIVKNRRLVRLGTARTSAPLSKCAGGGLDHHRLNGVAGLPRTYLLIAHKAWLCTWF